MFKNCIILQNAWFSRLNQVARKSPEPTAKTLERKTFEKFSKCFSRLEVPLARESRSELWKSLCTSRDWTFHHRTSRQPEPQKAWKPIFLKNILSLFRDWSIYPPVSREKISIWAHYWGMRLVLPAIESPEQGDTVFEILTNFCKNKILSKNN